jgi:hypothetical protein
MYTAKPAMQMVSKMQHLRGERRRVVLGVNKYDCMDVILIEPHSILNQNTYVPRTGLRLAL